MTTEQTKGTNHSGRAGEPTAGAPGSPRRSRLRNLGPYLLLVGSFLVAFPFVRRFANPDGTSYVAVAQLWLSGDWDWAINGYWGPLLSWLIAPLLVVGVPGIDAVRVVQLVAAAACLPSLRSLSLRAGASASATDILLLVCAPLLVFPVLYIATPDILLTAILLRCCDLLFRSAFATSACTALAAGVWGGVGYLAKAYAAPVVLVLLPVGVLVHLLSTHGLRRAPLLRNGVLALAGFAVVFGGWAGVLSASYGKPLFSTSAGWHLEVGAPGSAGNALNLTGIYPPVRPGGLSAWEEPSLLPVRDRDGEGSPGSDSGPVPPLVQKWLSNALIIAGTFVLRGLPIAVLALIALNAFARRRQLPPIAFTGTLAAGAISAAGLVPIIATGRYVWFSIIVCVPAAAVGFDVAMRRLGQHARTGWTRPVIGVALVAVMVTGATQGLWPRDRDASGVVAVEQLSQLGGLDGAVATTGYGSWRLTLQLCHEVGCQYFGRPKARQAGAVADELSTAGVDHLVVWHDEQEEMITRLPEAGGPGILTVYTVTPDGLVLDRRIGESDR